jgi:predicted SAM-dependent methyltransferase
MVNTIPGEAHPRQQVVLYSRPILEKEEVDTRRPVQRLERRKEGVLRVGVPSLRFNAQPFDGSEAPFDHPRERRFVVRHRDRV